MVIVSVGTDVISAELAEFLASSYRVDGVVHNSRSMRRASVTTAAL